MTSQPFDPRDLEARIAAIRKLADELAKVSLKKKGAPSEAERLAAALQEQAAALRSRLRDLPD